MTPNNRTTRVLLVPVLSLCVALLISWALVACEPDPPPDFCEEYPFSDICLIKLACEIDPNGPDCICALLGDDNIDCICARNPEDIECIPNTSIVVLNDALDPYCPYGPITTELELSWDNGSETLRARTNEISDCINEVPAGEPLNVSIDLITPCRDIYIEGEVELPQDVLNIFFLLNEEGGIIWGFGWDESMSCGDERSAAYRSYDEGSDSYYSMADLILSDLENGDVVAKEIR